MAIDFVLSVRRERHPKAVAHRRAFKLWIGPKCANCTDEELTPRFLARIRAFHQSHACGIDRVLVVAVVELGLISDRLDLQRGRDQKRRSQCDLSDHQHSRDNVDQSAAVAAAGFFHDLGRVTSCAEIGGNQTGDERCHERDRYRESKNASVDGEIPPIRQRKGRRAERPYQHIHSPIRQEHASDRAEHGHNQTFSQHLANKSPPRGAERATNRKFFRAKRGAAELHVHHIHARDQQNENDCAQHRPNNLAQLHAGECVEQRLHAGRRKILIRLRIVLSHVAGKRNKLRIHLVESHAGLQPAHDRRGRIVGAQC